MNNSKKYIDPIILHFKRWSNKAYAIFNSMGKIVHIGFLSTIIHRLVTVKSLVFHGLLNLFFELNEKDTSEEELIQQPELPNIKLFDLLSILNIASVSKRTETSPVEIISILSRKNIFKAYFGSFLVIWNCFYAVDLTSVF